MKNSLLYLMIAFTGIAFGQAPAIEWEHEYGGSSYDISSDIIQTADGGFLTVGKTASNDGDITSNHGSGDVWLVKTTASGTIQWEKTYGGSSDDLAFSIRQTSDGGYIMAGETNSDDGDVTVNYGGADCWIVKLDVSGNIQWQKSYGGTWNECAKSIRQTSDGGYIFAGYTASNDIDVSGNHSSNGPADFWIVKINSVGVLQWQKCFGGFGDDTANGIMETSDGNFVAVGETWSVDGDVVGNHSNSSADAWVIKISSQGNLVWQKSLGGAYSDRAQSVVEAANGNYIIGASAQSNNGDVTGHHGVNDAYSDIWILALNPSGIVQWQNSLGGFNDEYLLDLQKTTDGGYIATGLTSSSDGDVTAFYGAIDCWVVKLNALGNLQWQSTFGTTGYDYGYAIKPTSDGGYVIAGQIVSGSLDRGGNPVDEDYWIIKLAQDNLNVNDINFDSLKLYPNPATDFIQIAGQKTILFAQITDINGKIVANIDQPENNRMEVGQLANGTYIVRIRTTIGEQNLKFIKE